MCGSAHCGWYMPVVNAGVFRVALAVPVVRSKWVYAVVSEPALEAAATARRAAAATSAGWRRVAEARLRRAGECVQREGTEFWEGAAKAPRASVKGRVHAVIEGALARVPCEETFLRDIAGLGALPLRLHYPDG